MQITSHHLLLSRSPQWSRLALLHRQKLVWKVPPVDNAPDVGAKIDRRIELR